MTEFQKLIYKNVDLYISSLYMSTFENILFLSILYF